jgi:hypothetical protein
VARAAWAAVLTITVALAVFLAAAEPTGGQPAPQAAEWLSAGLVFGGAIALLAVLGTRGPPMRRAGVLAAAAALTWALEATFLKTTTDTLAVSGIGGVLTSWPVYAFIAATITGTVLQQAALHVGPLSISQPLLVITDPFASIILSVWLFGERFTNSPAKITHRRRGLRRDGRRGHRADADSADRSHPVSSGQIMTDARQPHLRLAGKPTADWPIGRSRL